MKKLLLTTLTPVRIFALVLFLGALISATNVIKSSQVGMPAQSELNDCINLKP